MGTTMCGCKTAVQLFGARECCTDQLDDFSEDPGLPTYLTQVNQSVGEALEPESGATSSIFTQSLQADVPALHSSCVVLPCQMHCQYNRFIWIEFLSKNADIKMQSLFSRIR